MYSPQAEFEEMQMQLQMQMQGLKVSRLHEVPKSRWLGHGHRGLSGCTPRIKKLRGSTQHKLLSL